MTSDTQESDGSIRKLHGHVVIELLDSTLKADEAEYNEDTHVFKAQGNVYYRNYNRNEVIYCDSAEYSSDTQNGTFYHVRATPRLKWWRARAS